MQKTYQSYRKVKAEPMTHGEYLTYCCVKEPENLHLTDEGYLIEHLDDSGDFAHIKHKFRISWWPKKMFEDTYLEVKEKSDG